MNIAEDVSTMDAVMQITERLVSLGLERCNFDKEWSKAICKQLKDLEEVANHENKDVKRLTLYHCLLWKTGGGWTYARSIKEMGVTYAYHPKILLALKDQMSSATEISCKSLEDFEQETLEPEFSALLGSTEQWTVIGILQFFAEMCSLHGPTSQDVKLVNITDGNDWAWAPATERSDALNERRWPGNLVKEDFTRSNTVKKLFEIRPPQLEAMTFAQFLCHYRQVRPADPEYKQLKGILENVDDKIGPRCMRTTIVGTLEPAPKYFMLENDQILRLRGEKNVILRLNNHKQVLTDKAKVFLFSSWRRAETALTEEGIANVDIKKCDNLRLLLFPSSVHASE